MKRKGVQRVGAGTGMAFVAALILLAVALLPATVSGQCSDMLGRWPYGPPETVAAEGSRLYVSNGAVLVVADSSDPDNPHVVGEVVLPERVQGVAVVNSYAFVADGAAGLQVVDATTPTAPFIAGCLNGLGAASGIAVSVPYVYVAADGLRVVDISNPAAPVEVAIAPGVTGRKVILAGSRAYVADRGLKIVDLSVLADPVVVGSFEFSPHEYVVDAAVSGSYVYVKSLDEFGGGARTSILDASNPSSIAWVGEFPSSYSGPSEMLTSSKYLFTADLGGLLAFDLANPLAPVIVGQVGLPSCPVSRMTVSGALAYVACSSGGLQVVDLSACCVSPKRLAAYLGSAGKYDLQDLAVSGSYLYATDYRAGLRVLDIGNPTDPREVAVLPVPSPWGFALSGHYAYVTTNERVPPYETGLQVVDIGTPRSPQMAGWASTPDYAIAVAVSGGGDYAYVAASFSGLQVFNVTDAANPQVVGGVDTPGIAFDVATAGGYAYVADGEAGLQIIDVSSDPSQPRIVGSLATPSEAHAVIVSGNYVFVGDDRGLQIVDVSVPIAPGLVASMETPSSVNAVAVSGSGPHVFLVGGRDWMRGMDVVDFSVPSAPVDLSFLGIPGRPLAVAVSGSYVYVGGDALYVVDVTVPSAPVRVDVVRSPWAGVAVDTAGSYAYVADQVAGLRVVDLTDPAAPAEVGTAALPAEAVDVTVAGALALVSAGEAGVFVLDTSVPTSPVSLGVADTPGMATAAAASGVNAYVADGAAGLQVFDLTGPPFSIVGSLDTTGEAQAVAVSGIYAYVADGTEGLEIIDISAPAAPTEAGRLALPGSAQDVVLATAGPYAYVSCGDDGLWVVDVSTPDAPRVVGSVERAVRRLTLEGSLLYSHPDGMVAFDVSEPTAPRQIGFWGDMFFEADVAASGSLVFSIGRHEPFEVFDASACCQGLQPRGQLESVGPATDVAVAGGAVYLVGPTLGLRTMDISDPSVPRPLGYLPVEASDIAVSGSWAYLLVPDAVEVVDVSDPASPQTTGSAEAAGQNGDIAAAGPYAYVAGRGPGFLIVDAESPAAPFVAGTLPLAARSVAASGGYAYATDDQALRVIDVANATSPVEVANLNMGVRLAKVVLDGAYAHILDDVFNLHIIDVTMPTNPREIGSLSLGGEASDVAASFGLACAVGPWRPSSPERPSLWIVDVSDPTTPREAAALPTPCDPGAVAMSGPYAYVAGAAVGLEVYDLTGCCTGVFRFESRGAIAVRMPDAFFGATGLPWLDPDDVLGPLAPPLLFYRVTFPSTTVVALKDALTVRLDAK